MSSLELVNVCKAYHHQNALRNVSLSLPQSTIALLGPNGAGKTTLLRILATLTEPDSGEVVFGSYRWHNKKQIKSLIGYLPQHFNFYPYLTVRECLEYIAVLKNVEKRQVDAQVTKVMGETNLADVSDKRIQSLSGGMRRRLGIAQTLIASPQILLIDEPTAGLDPKECIRFRSCVHAQAEGKTAIISTHIAQDVEAMCQYVAVLVDGTVRFWGTTREMIRTAEGHIMEEIVSLREANDIRTHHDVIHEQCSGTNDVCIRYLLEDVRKTDITPTLEDAYFLLMQGKGVPQ